MRGCIFHSRCPFRKAGAGFSFFVDKNDTFVDNRNRKVARNGRALYICIIIHEKRNDMKKATELFEVTVKNAGNTSRHIVSERWQITSIEKQNQGALVSYKKI